MSPFVGQWLIRSGMFIDSLNYLIGITETFISISDVFGLMSTFSLQSSNGDPHHKSRLVCSGPRIRLYNLWDCSEVTLMITPGEQNKFHLTLSDKSPSSSTSIWVYWCWLYPGFVFRRLVSSFVSCGNHWNIHACQLYTFQQWFFSALVLPSSSSTHYDRRNYIRPSRQQWGERGQQGLIDAIKLGSLTKFPQIQLTSQDPSLGVWACTGLWLDKALWEWI